MSGRQATWNGPRCGMATCRRVSDPLIYPPLPAQTPIHCSSKHSERTEGSDSAQSSPDSLCPSDSSLCDLYVFLHLFRSPTAHPTRTHAITQMTSRININRPAPPPSYGQAVYQTPHVNGNGMGSFDASSESPFEKLRVIGSKVEDQIDSLSQPVRPYLPAVGRFLIVVTFLEDALRIVTQWSDQIWYLQR